MTSHTTEVRGEIQWVFVNDNKSNVHISIANQELPNNESNNESNNLLEESSKNINEEMMINQQGERIIPDTVLQYERQRRKVQASQRSEQLLTAEKHLKIIYQDEHLLVANKPSGILCVPGLHNKPSLLDLVYEYCNKPLENRSSMIVHRLDMDTSGLVLFAKTEQALLPLQQAFRERKVEKVYEAVVCGHIEPSSLTSGSIDLPLQRDHKHPPFMRVSTPQSEQAAIQAVQDLQQHGWKKLVRKKPKPSQTHFEILQREWYNNNDINNLPRTRLALFPQTGRTHQLRVHCAALGHPIIGDPAYGLYGEANANGGLALTEIQRFKPILKEWHQIHPPHDNPMCLHAKRLCLDHPITQQHMEFEVPAPF